MLSVDNWLSNTVSKSFLAGGHVFKPHRMFISRFIKPKRGCLSFVYLWACGCLHVSSCMDMELYMREGVGVHDIHYRLKS